MKKKLIKILINNRVRIDLLIMQNREQAKIIKMIKEGVYSPLKFFNNIKNIRFGIEVIYNRAEFNGKLGYKTEDWVTAHSFGDKFIIFSQNAIEEYTTHRKGEFIPIISHETSHIFLKKMSPQFSTWMNEGLAQNIAKQIQKQKIKQKNINHFVKNSLFKNSNYSRFIEKQGYEISYKLVNYLLNRYSKEKIFKLLAIRYGFNRSAEKKFCKILGLKKDEVIHEFITVLRS